MPAFSELSDRERLQVSTGQQRRVTHALSIANGQAVTAWKETYGCYGLSVDVPSSWTTADLTVEFSEDGATSGGKLRDASGEAVRIVIGSTSLGGYTLTPDVAWGVGARNYFRLVSTDQADETNENQGGTRSLTAHLLI